MSEPRVVRPTLLMICQVLAGQSGFECEDLKYEKFNFNGSSGKLLIDDFVKLIMG